MISKSSVFLKILALLISVVQAQTCPEAGETIVLPVYPNLYAIVGSTTSNQKINGEIVLWHIETYGRTLKAYGLYSGDYLGEIDMNHVGIQDDILWAIGLAYGECGVDDKRNCIYVGDMYDQNRAVGTNGAEGRENIGVYKIVEPSLTGGFDRFLLPNLEYTNLRFKFPDGLRSTQTFFFDPVTRTHYIVGTRPGSLSMFQTSADADPNQNYTLSYVLETQIFSISFATKSHIVMGGHSSLDVFVRIPGETVSQSLSRPRCLRISPPEGYMYNRATRGADDFEIIYFDHHGINNYAKNFDRSYSWAPTASPSSSPTLIPTMDPTMNPTMNPTLNPTMNPTLNPTMNPTLNPTMNPTLNPTMNPTMNPTIKPTLNPTMSPTMNPTMNPTLNSTLNPTNAPQSARDEDYTATVVLIFGGGTILGIIAVGGRHWTHARSNDSEKFASWKLLSLKFGSESDRVRTITKSMSKWTHIPAPDATNSNLSSFAQRLAIFAETNSVSSEF